MQDKSNSHIWDVSSKVEFVNSRFFQNSTSSLKLWCATFVPRYFYDLHEQENLVDIFNSCLIISHSFSDVRSSPTLLFDDPFEAFSNLMINNEVSTHVSTPKSLSIMEQYLHFISISVSQHIDFLWLEHSITHFNTTNKQGAHTPLGFWLPSLDINML